MANNFGLHFGLRGILDPADMAQTRIQTRPFKNSGIKGFEFQDLTKALRIQILNPGVGT